MAPRQNGVLLGWKEPQNLPSNESVKGTTLLSSNQHFIKTDYVTTFKTTDW